FPRFVSIDVSGCGQPNRKSIDQIHHERRETGEQDALLQVASKQAAAHQRNKHEAAQNPYQKTESGRQYITTPNGVAAGRNLEISDRSRNQGQEINRSTAKKPQVLCERAQQSNCDLHHPDWSNQKYELRHKLGYQRRTEGKSSNKTHND